MTELEKVEGLIKVLYEELGWARLEVAMRPKSVEKVRILESEIYQLEFDKKLLIRDDGVGVYPPA